MSSIRSKIIIWGSVVLLSFLAGLGTGRWIWRTRDFIPDSITAAQGDVQQVFDQGFQLAQVFTLSVAGSVTLIVFLVLAIIVRMIQSSRRGRKDG